MKSFDLYSTDLEGIKLIEASAGTGKTFTLSGLYIRTIVEKKLPPEKILVLTFTKAATLELKTRLREQLIQCKNHILGLETLSNANMKLFDLYEKYKQDESAIQHINLALACFDQASILTINGFCQKIIDDYNSECGSVVFLERIEKRTYIHQFVNDFWRLQQKSTPIQFLSLIPKIDDIQYKLSSLLNKHHYRQIKPKFDWSNVQQLHAQHKALKDDWKENTETVLDYLFSGCFGRKFGIRSREKYRAAMQGYLYTFELPKTNFVERFTFDFLENERKSASNNKTPDFILEFSKFYVNINALPFSFIYECWQYVQQQLQQLLNEKGMYDYDDQIEVVHQAVQNNPTLAKHIGKQWQCVMVDEFQDTDALQLEIFQHCFHDDKHQLIYVGDPKQAIYDFRGADVYVYQQAKEQIKQHYNLSINWRSSAPMLAASNALFDFENSFKMPQLNFIPSEAKPDQSQQLKDDCYAPLTIINASKGDRQSLLANELKRLVSQAYIVDDGVSHPIAANEIAVLVKSNNQAIELYEYLLSHDLKVSLWSESGVCATECAKHLYYLLRAISYPSLENIKTSYHGLFFNQPLDALQRLDKEQHVGIFVALRLDSFRNGLVETLDRFFQEKQVYQQLLQRIDGERHYTDLMQLMELLKEQQDQGSNEKQLAQWLAVQIKQSETIENDENRKRRLESDGEKIAIMTLHKSKGLEFSCVFIPYADLIKDGHAIPNENKILKACIATHDVNQKGVMYWQQSEQAGELFLAEKAAENRRNLYVAITRAKHRVYLGLDFTDAKFDNYPIAQLYNNYIKNNEIPPVVQYQPIEHTPSTEKKISLNISTFKRNLQQPKSIYSFSALAKRQEISFERSEIEDEIDYSNYFQFPKGAKSGTMQHEIFENLDFSSPMENIQKEVITQLEKYDFDARWSTCLSQQIDTVLKTQLWHKGPRLSQLKNRRDEMEFMLPAGSISRHKISQWLTQHRHTPTQFKQDKLQGFLTGFIDLVFEYDQRYYVVDYKTNDLGSSVTDYSNDNLKAAIEHHYYDLQYLLYCVALVKYLHITVDGFDYRKHFGGIAYVFTRGITGEAGQGIYKLKPDEQLINEMIGAFDAGK